MKIKFLGTAAFEGIPALFCRCTTCETSRKMGGRNLRKRSSAFIDDRLLIDFTNDILHYCHAYDLDLSELEHLLITHSHSDHFNYHDLEAKLPAFRNNGQPVLNIYANNTCTDILRNDALFQNSDFSVSYKLHTVEPFVSFHIEDYKVTPLPAKHHAAPGETCLMYLIEHEGKRIFYGLDSGVYDSAVLDYLSHTYLDLLVMDCTMGHQAPNAESTHMCIEDNVAVSNHLRGLHALDKQSQLVSHHFSHNGKVVYDLDLDLFNKKGLSMAYDGMEIHL